MDLSFHAGIEPFVTLSHWYMPQTLENECGDFAARELCKIYSHNFFFNSSRTSRHMLLILILLSGKILVSSLENVFELLETM